MAAPANRATLVLPILLAVIGVASLATAVMLVPLIIRESVAQMAPLSPNLIVPPVAQPQNAAAEAPPASVETAEPELAGEPPAAAEPVAATPATAEGPWSLELDEESYTLSARSEQTLGDLVVQLKSTPNTIVLLTGINNPMRSSRRAKRAATRVKEILIESGVERYRLRTAGTQKEGTEGLTVEVAIIGVAK